MILTATLNTETIPVIVAGVINQARFYEYGPLLAARVLAILPPVAVAFFVQGARSGAVKG